MNMNISTLGHRDMRRPGSSSGGAFVTERLSADFLIDGKSLLQTLVKTDGGHSDFMSCLVSGFPKANQKALAKLLCKASPDTERGGVLLYICPECGDIGCGAYTACIRKTDGGFVWENFAFENGREEPVIAASVGPFHFAGDAYRTALSQAAYSC